MAACEVCGIKVAIIQQCRRTKQWVPTCFFVPGGAKAKASAAIAKPIFMVQHDGHYRMVLLSSKQAQAVFKQQSRADSSPKDCPRAASKAESPSTSELE
eukprot:4026916-Alexandrium_andersonii.AAC.1